MNQNFEFPDINNIKGSNVYSWIKRDYPELYRYIMTNKDDRSFSEQLYLFYHDLTKPPTCEVCGKPVKFKGFEKGYPKTCGRACTARHPEYKLKSKQTCLEKYGVDNPRKSLEVKLKAVATCLEKYGVESPNQLKEVKIKQKLSKTQKYGNPNYCNPEAIKRTKKLRYGDPTYNNREKSKQTCFERYGVEHTTQIDDMKIKSKRTKLLRYGDSGYTNREQSSKTTYEHYGVSYGIYIPGARTTKSKDSRPNINFKNMLDKLNISYEREYRLGNFIYDFKIGSTLIDVNPSITHNSTINVFGGPVKDKWYHFNKTKNAHLNGYQCICVWDWIDPRSILDKNSQQNVQSEEPGEHWYNLKTHEHIEGHIDNPGPAFVLIWDDGQKS